MDIEKGKNINALIKLDDEISNFEKKITSESAIKNYELLKYNLAEMQISSIMKKNHCDDTINDFITLINKKISLVNTIKSENLQVGGGNISNENQKKYLLNYAKYMYKYINEINIK